MFIITSLVPFTYVLRIRYHRTLKDVGLSSRMSAGNLIDKILKVNLVQIAKSRHADFEQRLKVHYTLPADLKCFDHKLMPFILHQLIEQHEKSMKSPFQLHEVSFVTYYIIHTKFLFACCLRLYK